MIPKRPKPHSIGVAGLTEPALVDAIVEFYRRLATDLPPDVERALRSALAAEPEGSPARATLEVILANVQVCRAESLPLCQDTGIPVFDVSLPLGMSRADFESILAEATRKASASIPLRPNAVDPVTGLNTGDSVGPGIPMLHFRESAQGRLVLSGMLKGGGCENVAITYKLPDPSLGAARDLDGVRRCVLDAVWRAQGRACPPYVLGVGIGGAVDAVASLAKSQLMRALDDSNPVPQLDLLEKELLDEANRLGIGPGGLGGSSTVLAVKAAAIHRHPASFFVAVSFSCWATRRGVMTVREGEVTYAL